MDVEVKGGEEMGREILTKKIKNFALEKGGHIVGVASSERFKNAPFYLRPEYLLPEAKSVIVVGMHYPDACIELWGEPTPHDFGSYDALQGDLCAGLDNIAFHMAKYLEKNGYLAIATAVTVIWRYKLLDNKDECFIPDISHIHAATAAGMGEIGWSGLFLSPEYGPRQRLTSIITDAPLKPDPMYGGPSLCDKCFMCVKACPTKAFSKEVKGTSIVKIEDKTYQYVNKNKWRCAWSEHFALDLDLPIPEKVDDKVILKTLVQRGRRNGVMGYCLKYCLPPHLRKSDPQYSRVFRRKRKAPVIATEDEKRKMTEKVKNIAFKGGMDLIGIVPVEQVEKLGENPEKFLPDANTIIAIGIRLIPPVWQIDKGERVNTYSAYGSVKSKLGFVGLGIAKYLEELGYSVMVRAKIDNDIVASVTGLSNTFESYGLATIITSAPLISGNKTNSKLKYYKAKSKDSFTKALVEFARSAGADLVGVSSVERLNKIIDQASEYYRKTYIEAEDKGGIFAPVVPKLSNKRLVLKKPKDYLPNAKSVIVMGIHYPYACLEQVYRLPNVISPGPYGYAQYETLRQLDYLNLEVSRFLEHSSYHRVSILDLGNSSSKTANGIDAQGNRFAAIAAGMGEIGWHGVVITPEYGVTQRFIAIITDANLEQSSLYSGEPLCNQCFQCINICPVHAISKDDKINIKIEGKNFSYGKCDRQRCDWSKRYALVAEEGSMYMGSLVDIKPPLKITKENFGKALKQVDPLQKVHRCIAEKCLAFCQNTLSNRS